MSGENDAACVGRIEEICRKKRDGCFVGKINGLSCVISVITIAIAFVFLVIFLYGRVPTEIKVEETVEYATSSYIYPCYPYYTQFYKNRFPYRHVTKNSSATFITFVICASCVLVVVLFCVAMLTINANTNELKRKMLCALYLKFDEIKISELDSEPKDNEIDKKQNKDASEEHKTEYYPKTKAVADIYKAYANAIAEL